MDSDVKGSIVRRIEFARSELNDLAEYASMDYVAYGQDRVQRRNVERIVENIANSAFDIGKMILSTCDTPMPESYRGVFVRLGEIQLIDASLVESLIAISQLRNVLAHQYLDIKWDYIKRFIATDAKTLGRFLGVAEEWVAAQDPDSAEA